MAAIDAPGEFGPSNDAIYNPVGYKPACETPGTGIIRRLMASTRYSLYRLVTCAAKFE